MPLCVFSSELFTLWLGKVPDYTIGFMKIIMLHSVIRSIHYPLNNLFKTVGNLKRYQIAEIIILSLPLVASYLLLRYGCEPYAVFWTLILFETINYAVIIAIAKKDAYLPIEDYIRRTIMPCVIIIFAAVIDYLICMISKGIFYRLVTLSASLISLLIIMYIIGLNSYERQLISNLLKIKKQTI